MNKTFGILHLSDRCIIKDGKKISKRFTSFDKSISTIDVKTKKTNMHDIYCIVNVKEKSVEEYLETIKVDSIPKYIATCNWKKIKINIDDYQTDLTPDRINLLDIDNIISIDPEGSLDIDDAIHYKSYDEYIELGIHIADPSSYIMVDSELDKELQKRCSSLYFLNETIHMLPTELATDLISLRENEIKRSHSLIIRFDKNYKLIDFKFVKGLIKPKKNLTYDYAQSILNSTNNDFNIKDLYELSKIINKNYNIDIVNVHDMIALYMIFANNLCGIKLKNTLSIVRVNNKKENHLELDIKDKFLSKLYDNCLQTKAEYKLNLNNIKHEGLNLELYAHFTSPIRRYQDLITHRILSGYDYTQDILDMIIKKINDCTSLYKFATNLDKLNSIMNDDNFIEIKCKIIFIDNDSMMVYYDKKNLMLKIDYVNYKIKDIIDKKNNYDSIELYINDSHHRFELFQDLNIKIYRIKLQIQMFKFILNII